MKTPDLENYPAATRIIELEARIAELEEDRDRLRGVLTAVDEWDLQWADGLDANVERIKMMVRAVLEEE